MKFFCNISILTLGFAVITDLGITRHNYTDQNKTDEEKNMAEVGKPRSPRLPIGPKTTLDMVGIPIDSVVGKTSTQQHGDDEVIFETPEVIHNATVTILGSKDGEEFEELKRAKIPTPPSKKILESESQVFYDYLASLKAEHWLQLSWYFYRKFPRIVRPDEQKYIDCGNYAFNEDWILREHGSGDYMCILNDSGKPKNAKTLVTAHMKINDPTFPPKIKMDELDVHYPGNRFYVDKMIAEGKLTTDKKPMNQVQGNGGLSEQIILKLLDRADRTQIANLKDPKDSAIQAAFDIIGQGNKAATQMMIDQMKQDSPEKLVSLVSAIAALIPKPVEHKSEDNGMMKLLIDTQNKNAELLAKKDDRIFELMIKALERKETPVTPVGDDSFDKSLDRFTKLMELTGMGEGSGKKSTLETIMQYSMPVVQNIAGIIQNLTAIRAQGLPKLDPQTGQEIPNSVNKPGTSGLPVAISSATPTNENQNTQATSTNNGGVEGAMENNAMIQEQAIKQGLKQIGPRIIDALNRGVSGDQFAESIEGFMGPMIYEQLASLGEIKILEILKTDQQLWAHLATVEGALNRFIKEFIKYGEPVEDDNTIEMPGGVVEEMGKKIN